MPKKFSEIIDESTNAGRILALLKKNKGSGFTQKELTVTLKINRTQATHSSLKKLMKQKEIVRAKSDGVWHYGIK